MIWIAECENCVWQEECEASRTEVCDKWEPEEKEDD